MSRTALWFTLAAGLLSLLIESCRGSWSSNQVSPSHNLRLVPNGEAMGDSKQAGEQDFNIPRKRYGVKLPVDNEQILRTQSGQPLVTETGHLTDAEPASRDSTTQMSKESHCPSGSGISVSSLQFPHMDGCLVDTGSLINGKAVYSSTTVAVLALVEDEDIEDDGFFYLRWYASYRTSEGWGGESCFSAQYASSLHPAEVSWICVTGVDGGFESMTGGKFSVSCGCDEQEIAADAGAPSEVHASLLSTPVPAEVVGFEII